MNLQLIATDIDDTLLASGWVMPPQNIVALQAAHASGIRIVLATIRKRDSTEMVGNLLNLPYAMICQGGAMIYDYDGSCLHEAVIELELARAIASFADAHGIAMITTIAEHNSFVGNAEKVLAVAHAGQRVRCNMAALYAPPTRMLIPGTQAAQLLIDSFSELPLRFSRHYHNNILQDVVITAQSASKQHALTMLCERWDIKLNNVLALGDSEADIGMLQIAGVGVAMGNARPELCAIADWIAPSCAEGGVAAAVFRIMNAE